MLVLPPPSQSPAICLLLWCPFSGRKIAPTLTLSNREILFPQAREKKTSRLLHLSNINYIEAIRRIELGRRDNSESRTARHGLMFGLSSCRFAQAVTAAALLERRAVHDLDNASQRGSLMVMRTRLMANETLQ